MQNIICICRQYGSGDREIKKSQSDYRLIKRKGGIWE